MSLSQLEDLRRRLAALQAMDHSSANALLRDASVFARQVFGEESSQLQDLGQVCFRDQHITYNTEHYKNHDNWSTGVRRLNSVFEAMKYELDLMQSSKKELSPPSMVTIPWLLRHVPLALWGGALAVLATTFYLGHAAGSTSFFPKLIALIRATGSTP